MNNFQSFSFLLLIPFFLSITTIAFTQTLEQQVQTKIKELNSLIALAESKGIDTYKEQMTVRTAEIFLDYANWDENNVAENTTFFEKVPIYKDAAAQMATTLPDFERSECLLMLADAMATLQELKAEQIFRKPIPRIDWAAVTHDGDQLTFNNRPVFLNDYTWKPDLAQLNEFHGNLDGFYLSPTHVTDKNGTINSNIINDLNRKSTGTYGFVFLNNKAVPNWAINEYGNDILIRQSSFNFTAYDIDHPNAIDLIGKMLDGAVPLMANKKYTKLGYMLVNEPHFFTKSNVWATGEVSNYSIDKFKIWLANKHESIEQLNARWETNFTSFDAVTINIPISGNLQGTPKWYDWSFFNMHRVTEWYKLMKARLLESDPDAKVHLKIMPRLWSDNLKDHGIDFETLTRMSEIIGNDAGAWNNHIWGPTEWWEADYAFDWREMSMGYDFQKSVSPEKIAFNSESHYLSKNKSRNLYQDPIYARATYWLAHILGENATQTWYWARQADGSIRANAGVGYAGSNNQQPRIVNEVAATMMDLNSFSEEITAMQRQAKPLRIFHSKTSAINKATHMDDEFDLYKALFFEGISLGFATKDILQLQDNKNWEAILIHQTEYVTQAEFAALQTYLDNGGTIIMDIFSLKKDEYGQPLDKLAASNGNVERVTSMATLKSVALELLATTNLLPEIIVKETNGNTTKGVHWRIIKKEDGNQVLSLINLGNTDAQIELKSLQANTQISIKNLLKGIPIDANQLLKPNEVLFVEVMKEDATVSIEEEQINLASLFPNPFSGKFQVDFEQVYKHLELRIFNSEGKLVFQKTYQNVQNINADMTNKPSGSYHVQVNADRRIFSQTVIKK